MRLYVLMSPRVSCEIGAWSSARGGAMHSSVLLPLGSMVVLLLLLD